MPKQPIEKMYETHYEIGEHQYELENILITFDLLKDHRFDLLKPTYIFDIDHTLLNSNELKNHFNDAFERYNHVFSNGVWLETYKLAKTRENFYDFPKHIEILAQKLDGTLATETILKDLMEKTLESVIPDLIHPNLFWQINGEKEQINLVLATSGETTYHRMKVRSLIRYLPLLPIAVIYIEQADKGIAINEFYKHYNLPTNYECYLFDDNPSELEDVHQKCKDKKINLMRVKQPNGHYNHKVAAQLIRSEEWNFNS